MAFKKTLINRFLNISRFSNSTYSRNPVKPPLRKCSITIEPAKNTITLDTRDGGGTFRWINQQRPLNQSETMYHGIRSSLTEGNLMEKLKGMLIARDRLRLEGLCPPEPDPSSGENGLTARDVKKLLRASQMDMVKAKLRQIPKDWISYPEFVQICNESCSNDEEEGVKFAKMLDDSGDVIVLGNAVCLHPEQLMKAFQSLIPFTFLHPNGSRWKELEELEKQKEEIDRKAESLVRRELCFGLGYLVVQTATFMRLTFWELSWDVMEPICFYFTSMYFIFGYSFFLMTSKEPSFKGFFQSRFNSKQKKLLTVHNFDIHRYHELRRGLYPYSSGPSKDSLSFFAHSREYCR